VSPERLRALFLPMSHHHTHMSHHHTHTASTCAVLTCRVVGCI